MPFLNYGAATSSHGVAESHETYLNHMGSFLHHICDRSAAK